MDAGGIYGVDGMYAAHDRRNHRPREFVNKRAKGRVFLRWPTHHGERPDGIGPMPNTIHRQHRKRMRETVVAEVIAERPFRKQLATNCAGDANISIGSDRQSPVWRA